MNAEQAFEELIETLARRAAGGGMGCRVDVGTVKDVNEREGKPEMHEVRLNAVIDERVKDVFRIIPATGSYVMVLQMGMAEGMVLATSKIERVEIKTGNVTMSLSSAGIVMNGGELGGMIDIGKLTDKVNDLVEAFNGHTHQVSTTGSASAQSGTAAVIASKAKKLDRGDYENKKVKH